MKIFTPNINITLDSQEEKAIKDCIFVLTSVQKEMTKLQCNTLADSFGQIVTLSEIDDTLTICERLLDVVEMYDD